MPTRPTPLTAAAGEYFVAHTLSVQGYCVGIPRANTPGVDLLVSNQSGSKTVAIQVKTSDWAYRERKRKPEESHWEWDVGAKALDLRSDNLIYAFVDLKSGGNPDVFLVPSKTVAGFLGKEWKRYMFWIWTKDKDKYFARWDMLRERLAD